MRFTLLITVLVAVFSARGPGVEAADQVATSESALPAKVSFNRDIRPILSQRCFACHGPDAKALKGKLKLHDRADSVRDRDGYAAIVPGKPDASEVMLLISSDDDNERMPPSKVGEALSPREIALVKRWIEQGAAYESHWAFIAPKRPTQPALTHVKNKQAVRNGIDAFILAKLEAAELSPSAEADRPTLIRRATLDFTGLLPTKAEVDAFVNDRSANAYEKVIDRLLASPRYGEHLSRYWLDAARYADTNGYQYDRQRNQWVWRDWVIHAFNTNKPFDQFTIEQMAGDLLPNATDQTRLATGFHRNHPITIEGGVIDEEYRTEYVMDRVVTSSTTFMGLTFLCARCHDHKYDPISQDDFYSFYAFFNNVPERGLNGFAPQGKIASPLQGHQQLELQAQLETAQKKLAAALNARGWSLLDWENRLQKQAKTAWSTPKPTAMKSAGGATLTRMKDGSILAGGKNPGTETYDITLPPSKVPVSVIQLEALKHPSLTNGSTSRGSNGNYVLTEFIVEAADAKNPTAFKRVRIASAEADYSQKNFHITQAIDGKVDKKGWAVDGNTRPEDREALFTLATPIAKGSHVRIRMVSNYGLSHQIGRFRISFPTDGQGPVPPSIKTILAVPMQKRTPAQTAALTTYLASRFGGDELAAMTGAISKLQSALTKQTTRVPNTLIMAEMPKPRATYVLDRGEYDKAIKTRPVSPRVPSALGSMPKDAPRNRLGLARWMVSRDNPLTARVIVNRQWARLFGTGIVKTVEDFGSQGEWPSHPDLLDWLAVEFMDSKWDLKALLKTIAMSHTYRQSSHVNTAMLKRDPNNRLLARGARFRLDGEVVRDAALQVSGLLDPQIGGASVYPYHPKGLWLEVNNRPGYSRAYPHPMDAGNLYRRSLYTFWKRTVPPPSLSAFDAPTREFCVVQRSRTNTPLQAFVLLHDPQFVEAARSLGSRMMREAGQLKDAKDSASIVDARLRYGFVLCNAREPNAKELSILRTLLKQRLAIYRNDAKAAEAVLTVGQSPRDASLNLAEHAAYTTVARILLNLSEFMTKG